MTGSLRIALVSEHASPLATLGGADAGGQNVHVAALARQLAIRGHQVDVYTRRSDPSLAERVDLAPGVVLRHVDAGPPQDIAKDDLFAFMDDFAEVLRSEWAQRPPDLVHSHFWMSGYASLRAAEPLGIPVVHTFHALGVVKRRHQAAKDTSPAERLAVERDIIERCAHIVATCSDEVFELKHLGAPVERISVVPCGVDPVLFRPDGPREARRPGRRRVVSVGRLVERKGVGTAIEALARVPDTELVVAGGPPAEGLDADADIRRLRAVAIRHGVDDRVELRGRVERGALPALIRSADVVICVPWYEPFGIVPLEAMACGVPVLASAVGGLVDTVVDGVTGRHVPPRDVERTALGLCELLDDPDRAAYGRAGVVRVRRRFAWERVGDATVEVYRSVLERAGRPTITRRPWRTERPAPTMRKEGPVMTKANPMPAPHADAAIDLTGGDERSRRLVDGVRDELVRHLGAAHDALASIHADLDALERWSEVLAGALACGGRLLVAGNGGSAAHAQHLSSELVGRFRDDRIGYSAIALHADPSAVTAIVNDYGADQVFARQVLAHGRRGDALALFSTSGRSRNLLRAAEVAGRVGLHTLAVTGPAPNPLADRCREVIAIEASSPAAVQEAHQVVVHLICVAFERALEDARPRVGAPLGVPTAMA